MYQIRSSCIILLNVTISDHMPNIYMFWPLFAELHWLIFPSDVMNVTSGSLNSVSNFTKKQDYIIFLLRIWIYSIPEFVYEVFLIFLLFIVATKTSKQTRALKTLNISEAVFDKYIHVYLLSRWEEFYKKNMNFCWYQRWDEINNSYCRFQAKKNAWKTIFGKWR